MDELDLLSPARRRRGRGWTDGSELPAERVHPGLDLDLCSVCDTQDPEFHTHKFAMPVFGQRIDPRKGRMTDLFSGPEEVHQLRRPRGSPEGHLPALRLPNEPPPIHRGSHGQRARRRGPPPTVAPHGCHARAALRGWPIEPPSRNGAGRRPRGRRLWRRSHDPPRDQSGDRVPFRSCSSARASCWRPRPSRATRRLERMTDPCRFRSAPRPCGHHHHSFRALLRCLVSNGSPGFEVREVPDMRAGGRLSDRPQRDRPDPDPSRNPGRALRQLGHESGRLTMICALLRGKTNPASKVRVPNGNGGGTTPPISGRLHGTPAPRPSPCRARPAAAG